MSSVSNGASVSGLFILGYPSVFSNVYLRLAIPKLKCPKVVQHLVITIRYVIIDVSYLCLWIVLVLCLVWPMLSVSLDCLSPVSCMANVVCISGLS